MTKLEWDAATVPVAMLAFVESSLSERKRRLFGCACCRRVWGELTDVRSQAAIEAAEQYSEGKLTEFELEVVANEASFAWSLTVVEYESNEPYPFAAAAYNVAIDHGWWGGAPAFVPPDVIVREASADPIAEGVAQCALLHDIVNPFAATPPDPAWLTDTVLGIARNIDALGDFTRLPILADALEDAGCDDAELLDHCRGMGPHVRGCWVIDALLNKR